MVLTVVYRMLVNEIHRDAEYALHNYVYQSLIYY